ncbi:MAG: NB-ARC domain-containing protein, partial [Acidobacteria bacterium]|nr:NB-ARC domain-containing protein [Acidobacteriota bacterium]
MPDKPRIFISYARRDGAALAQRLQRDLEAAGFDAWLDVQRLRGGASWTVEIEQAIDRSGVLLAILTRGSYESDICRAEQLRSLRLGKSVIPLLGEPQADRPLHLETKNYRDFTGDHHYPQRLQALLEELGGTIDSAVLPQRFRTTHVTAPPLPRNYIVRHDELARLRAAVLADEPGPSVALTALKGMGGIGKTILAQALSRDPVIQEAYPDGVVWVTVGQDPAHSLLNRMQQIRLALGDEPGANESELHCTNCYRTTLRDRAALVIVDDVWRVQDIEPFLAESPRSRLLFTTRDGDIANATQATLHEAGLLTLEESRALLARSSGLGDAPLPSEAAGLVGECGRLALAVSMIGAMLRGKPQAYWAHVLKLLKSADLERIGFQLGGYPHAGLLKALQVSVDGLSAQARQRYLALAVLLEDMPAHPLVQRA